MFSAWVQGGGNLVAMRPDKKLAGLLGLADAGGTRDEGNLTSVAGGVTGASMRFHGSADLYGLAGASPVATLDSGQPAVTLRDVGGAGGQAAAFTYDLARSVVYTRQGNPAWAGTERDGNAEAIRSDDMFFGGTQPDWVDLNRVQVPAADEQQRMLANLDHRHGERPHAAAALLVPAARPEGGRRPHGRRPQLQHGRHQRAVQPLPGRQPARMLGRAVAVRALDLLPLPGHVGHRTPRRRPSRPRASRSRCTSGCRATPPGRRPATATATTSRAPRPRQRPRRAARSSSARPTRASSRRRPTATTASSTATGPACRASSSRNGIRLDTNYYYWPGAWVQDRPGFFTGSGFPQRFAETDGSLIDVYQAATQLTDESGQDIAGEVRVLLDNAHRARRASTASSRPTCTPTSRTAPAPTRSSPRHRRAGCPIVSARQMLTWLDGRNTSSFQGLAFSGGRLSFSVAQGAGATGLQAMLPASGPTGALQAIARNGQPVSLRDADDQGHHVRDVPRGCGLLRRHLPRAPARRAGAAPRERASQKTARIKTVEVLSRAHVGADLPAPEAQHARSCGRAAGARWPSPSA